MNRLDAAIARLVTELHPERVEVIAQSIERSEEAGVFWLLKASAGLPTGSALLSEVQEALTESPLTGNELSGRLRSAVAVARLLGAQSSIELVWSGPSTGMVPIRRTEQVLTGLIDEARDQLFLVSFVAYNVQSVLEALKRADAKGVRIRVLMERSRAQGGSVTTDSIATLRVAIPHAEFLASAQPGSSAEPAPKVHAKCAVADGRVALITSANLTDAAMETNMELGVLIRGGVIPDTLTRHLEALVTVGRLKILH